LGEAAAYAEEGERHHEANVHAARCEFEGLEGLKRGRVIERRIVSWLRVVIVVLGLLIVHAKRIYKCRNMFSSCDLFIL
jgi:hypothetical protein